MKLSLGPFRGIAPKVPAELLPEGFAQEAVNCRFLDGALAAMPGPADVNYTKSDGTVVNSLTGKANHDSIFRFGEETAEGFCWASFSPYTNIVRGFIVDQNNADAQRYYFTGDQWPRVITYADVKAAIAANADLSNATYSNNLGVPAPADKPTVKVEGLDGDDVFVTNYFYTYVVGANESLRSPVVSVSTLPHQATNDPYPVDLTFTEPPADVDFIRIYRYAGKLPVTQPGGTPYTGDTENRNGFRVAEIPAGQLSYKDSDPDVVTGGTAYSVSTAVMSIPQPSAPASSAIDVQFMSEEIAVSYRMRYLGDVSGTGGALQTGSATQGYRAGFPANADGSANGWTPAYDLEYGELSQSTTFQTIDSAINSITLSFPTAQKDYYNAKFAVTLNLAAWTFVRADIYRKAGDGVWKKVGSVNAANIGTPFTYSKATAPADGVNYEPLGTVPRNTLKAHLVPSVPPSPTADTDADNEVGERTYAVSVSNASNESLLSEPKVVKMYGGQGIKINVPGILASTILANSLTKKTLYRKDSGTWKTIAAWTTSQDIENAQEVTDPLTPIAGGADYSNTGLSTMLSVTRPTTAAGALCDLQLGTGEVRLYVSTFVSSLGEEGPPSPASDIATVYRGQTVTVENLTVTSADSRSTDFDIVKRRIYRYSANGSAGGNFYRVTATDIPAGQSSFVDTVLKDENLGPTCPMTWFPPPANLSGLCVVSNGVLSGFDGPRVYFCEPWRAHAWPPEYMKDTMAKIIAGSRLAPI